MNYVTDFITSYVCQGIDSLSQESIERLSNKSFSLHTITAKQQSIQKGTLRPFYIDFIFFMDLEKNQLQRFVCPLNWME